MNAANGPLVSVIIPTFNRAWAVGRAIDSVLEQDYRPFELIVVDDGSTDQTAEILARYGDQLTVVCRENRGVSAARNAGVARAQGDLIAFLDSDDFWRPQKLTVQVDFFTSRPDALICQTGEIWVRNGRRVNPGRRHRKLSGMIFTPSLELCLVSPSAVMMRKTLFSMVGGFDEALPACEDYDLWLRVTRRYPVYLIDAPLVVKTGGHPDQLSAAPGLDQYRIRSILNLLESNELTEDQKQAAADVLARKCRIYADGCRKRGRIDEARHYEAIRSSVGYR
ncbi:MAG: glycosyltransferase [Desulfobacteraceae bacterium]|jgi:glycosyltransferase involved in cell wall biosynthesis|nr:MAG: glycosyltransferase [Desulfobacteraceae bacterium]